MFQTMITGDCVRGWLELCARCPRQLDMTDHRGYTAMHSAAQEGSSDIVLAIGRLIRAAEQNREREQAAADTADAPARAAASGGSSEHPRFLEQTMQQVLRCRSKVSLRPRCLALQLFVPGLLWILPASQSAFPLANAPEACTCACLCSHSQRRRTPLECAVMYGQYRTAIVLLNMGRRGAYSTATLVSRTSPLQCSPAPPASFRCCWNHDDCVSVNEPICAE
jgi:hypothetical protein